MQFIPIVSSLLFLMVPVLGAVNQVETQTIASLQPRNWDVQTIKDFDRDRGIRLTVNTHADNNLRDDQLSLREAIAIVNGSLPIANLTFAEARHLSPPKKLGAIAIEFDLPEPQNTIELLQPLPPITTPGLTIDGLYLERGAIDPMETESVSDARSRVSTPVKIAPAPDTAPILRGLTIMADDVTIQGLHLYGFSSQKSPGSTPSAAILISGHLPEQFIGDEPPNLNAVRVPKNISIQDNWFGHEDATQSTFGIWIFNGENILIENNQITHHQGSGIISSWNARDLQIENNLIAENGLSGMPDGIRLEGNITGSVVRNNRISRNGGAGIFLFKPIGAVQIENNDIDSNGQRLSHPAIYLMGQGHEVLGNQIRGQNGAGVVVSASPKSDRNRIQGNSFANLLGLSIDLNADNGRSRDARSRVSTNMNGDGPNPPRNSLNRRLDTGNSGINAPKFLASEFFILNGQVHIDGIADPDTVVEIYQVLEPNNGYGHLSEPLITVGSDRTGRFNLSLSDIESGDIITATATHSDYGTSEPARNARIQGLENR